MPRRSHPPQGPESDDADPTLVAVDAPAPDPAPSDPAPSDPVAAPPGPEPGVAHEAAPRPPAGPQVAHEDEDSDEHPTVSPGAPTTSSPAADAPDALTTISPVAPDAPATEPPATAAPADRTFHAHVTGVPARAASDAPRVVGRAPLAGVAPDPDAPTAVAAIQADADAPTAATDEEAPVATAASGVRQIVLGIGVLVAVILAFVLLAPHIGFLRGTYEKVRQGDPVWLVLCVVLEVFSFAGYVWVLVSTTRRAGLELPRFTAWRITLAGVAATRVIATAGAGGIAATTFALRRQGMDARSAAAAVAAQIALVYAWFVVLVLITGTLLYAVGHAKAAITIVPAAGALFLLVVAAGGRSVLHRLASVSAQREGRVAEAVGFLPQALDDAVHHVGVLVRGRDLAIIGGALWWVADAGVLWAACQAFGADPNIFDVLMAYLLGQVANLLPIPGGLGVEAGLTGALIAFGQPAGVAVLAGVVQRLISTWLPAIPGALALAAIGRPDPDAHVVDEAELAAEEERIASRGAGGAGR